METNEGGQLTDRLARHAQQAPVLNAWLAKFPTLRQGLPAQNSLAEVSTAVDGVAGRILASKAALAAIKVGNKCHHASCNALLIHAVMANARYNTAFNIKAGTRQLSICSGLSRLPLKGCLCHVWQAASAAAQQAQAAAEGSAVQAGHAQQAAQGAARALLASKRAEIEAADMLEKTKNPKDADPAAADLLKVSCCSKPDLGFVTSTFCTLRLLLCSLVDEHAQAAFS